MSQKAPNMNVEAFWEPQSDGSQGEKDWEYLDTDKGKMLKTAFFQKV